MWFEKIKKKLFFFFVFFFFFFFFFFFHGKKEVEWLCVCLDLSPCMLWKRGFFFFFFFFFCFLPVSFRLLLLFLLVGCCASRGQECDEEAELARRTKENQALASAFSDVSACSSLSCTLKVEQRVDGIHAEIESRRALASECGFGRGNRTDESSSPDLVRHGCVLDAKELELRRQESLGMADLLRRAAACDTLACVLRLEDSIRAEKLKSRQARHTRNLACAAKQPGIAVVGTRKVTPPPPAPSKKKVPELSCCALIVEGLCLDFSRKLGLNEARDACQSLKDQYDIDTRTFFTGQKCKREGSIALCRQAASSSFYGNVLYFAPMSESRAREHCHENQGKFIVNTAKNWKSELTEDAHEVALGEIEGYKQFTWLLGSALGLTGPVQNVNGTAVGLGSRSSAANGASAASGPGNGSQTLRIIGVSLLSVFLVLATIVAVMLYFKTSVESQHKRRRAGEGYVKVSSPDGSEASQALIGK